MNRSLYLKVLLCCVLSISLFEYEYAEAQPEATGSKATEDVGRENPFEQIGTEQKQSLFQRVFKPEVSLTEPAPEIFAQTVMLKFLDAKSLKPALENMLSGYGTIAVDAKSNSLIVSDSEKNLKKIVEEIKKADRTPPQIMIEVVILDVQLDDDTLIGVNWDILSDKIYDISYRQNLTTTRLGSTIENATTTGAATAFNTTGTGGDFALISGTIRNVVHLLQQKKNVEILASPRILLMSGGSALIKTVEQIPYQEISNTNEGGSMTQTKFMSVGVILEIVEAKVTDNNDIMLTVKPSQTVNTGVSLAGVPIIDERKAETKLLLRDGEIVVMGGLRRQEKTKQVDQIPILGDLPIVGFIFKSTEMVVNNSELLVILSPHIYKGEPLTEEEMAKFNELRNRPLLKIPETWKQGMLPFEMNSEPNGI
jgi:type II secretory pathway component GspD/PulD (secretin)